MRFVRLSIVLSAAIAVSATPPASVFADIIRLNDGSSVEGVVKRNGDGYDVTDAGGKLSHVAAENVRGIELTAKAGSASEAESRLGSLRRAVENITDTKVILDRYARFIEQNKDAAIAREAEKDVATWRDRIARNMVKLGTHWVTPDEKAAIQERGFMVADQARQLLKQGRMKEAEPVLNQAIEEDPTNVSALYLRGWLLYNQEQLQPARKSFEAALALMSDHAPTLNNLAVVLWRMNAQVQALGYYEQAMLASPLNRDVLDNVAEALNALPVAQRSAPLAQKAARRFAEQNTALEQQMAQMGWYRWGSTWVDRVQLEQLKGVEAEVQKKLDALNTEFEGTKKKVQNMDDDIDDLTRRMRSMENSSYTRDAQGNMFRTALPQRYFDYDADIKKLTRERGELVAKLEALRTEAKKAQQQVPTPRFKSVQKLIGLEGTPVLPPTRGPAAPSMSPPARLAPAALPPATLTPPPAAPVAPPMTPPPSTRPAGAPVTGRPAVPDSLLAQ